MKPAEIAREEALLIGVEGVAALLGISSRSVYRLCDAGRIPRGIKLGAMLRWKRDSIVEWIAQGCPRPGEQGIRG